MKLKPPTLTAIVLWLFLVLCLWGLARAGSETVTFQWDYPSPPADLKEFIILSSPAVGGLYSQVAAMPYTPGSPTVYTYPAPVQIPDGQETTLFFVAVAADQAGNKSANSNEVSHRFDFLAPPPPITFTIKFSTRQP